MVQLQHIPYTHCSSTHKFFFIILTLPILPPCTLFFWNLFNATTPSFATAAPTDHHQQIIISYLFTGADFTCHWNNPSDQLQ